MEEIYAQLVKQAKTPGVGDIARLIESIGPPGEKRDEKRSTVEKLFDDLGVSGHNPQGHHVADSLDAYGGY